MGLSLAAGCGLMACAQDAAPVVKIGLIAPFEGSGRDQGYAALAAVRSLLDGASRGDWLAPHRVTLVAVNDDSDPQAGANQARALASDPDVIAVLGPFSSETAAAARQVAQAAGLAMISGAIESGESPALSVCPSPDAIEAGLARAGFGDAIRIGGDAAAAARSILELRSAGEVGAVRVGPDATWGGLPLILDAPPDTVFGVACGGAGPGGPPSATARAAAQAVMAAMRDANARGELTREGVRAELEKHGVPVSATLWEWRGRDSEAGPAWFPAGGVVP
jgi:hypothetical protein